MSFVAALLAPLTILLPMPAAAAQSGVAREQVVAPASGLAMPADAILPALDSVETNIFRALEFPFNGSSLGNYGGGYPVLFCTEACGRGCALVF